MLKFLQEWVKRLTTTGIDDNVSPTDASRIAMCNIFNLFSIGGFILFIFIIAYFKWWLIVFIELFFLLLFGGSLFLNKIKQYNFSRLLFLLAFCGFILFFGWLDYRHTVSVYYYLFLLPLMIFVLFKSQQVISITVSLAAVAITYILINEVPAPFYLRSHEINDSDETFMHILNVGIIFFIISFIAFHFAKMYHQMNESLSIKQKQLADNHSLARAGSWYHDFRTDSFSYSDEMKEIFRLESSTQKLQTGFIAEFLSDRDKERFNQNSTDAIKNKTSVENDYEINLKDGGKKFIVMVIQPVLKLDNEVTGLQGVYIDVTDESKIEIFLQEHLNEKEVLLDEIHHRINYNLSLITGFVQLQMIKTDDNHLREMLDVCRQRIATMTLIHEKMYAAGFNSTFFDDYLHELIENIKKSVATEHTRVVVVTNLEPIVLQQNNVLPCGLIINELMTNSFKHAFKGKSNGTINITMKRADNDIVITYNDDGAGYNETGEHSGIGMDLIQSLTQQLRGTIEIKSQNGFFCSIRFRALKD